MGESKPIETDRIEYELTLCEIEREYDPWMSVKARHGRSAGGDPGLNIEWQHRQLRMDHLLEEFFGRMVKLEAVGASDDQIAA